MSEHRSTVPWTPVLLLMILAACLMLSREDPVVSRDRRLSGGASDSWKGMQQRDLRVSAHSD